MSKNGSMLDQYHAAVARERRSAVRCVPPLWHMLRAAAIIRHRVVWRACGSDPNTWEIHMAMIRAVYGY